jgi:hypothetical protein
MTYYGVKSCFFDSGKISASILTTEADRKPENTQESLPKYDQYIDWYETRQKAERCYSAAVEEASA